MIWEDRVVVNSGQISYVSPPPHAKRHATSTSSPPRSPRAINRSQARSRGMSAEPGGAADSVGGAVYL